MMYLYVILLYVRVLVQTVNSTADLQGLTVDSHS